MQDNRYDTIVAGGGIAGLTAAAYLARAGQKVLLLEKNRELGGLVNSFTRDGFLFDAGVRALEDAGIIRPMLRDLGIKLEEVPSPVSLGIENEIMHIRGRASLAEYSAFLKKFFPARQDEIDWLVKTIRKIMKDMDVLYGIENPIFMDPLRDRAYLFQKLLPWLPRFLLTIGRINRRQLPIEDYLRAHISDPSLRDIISQHFFKGTPTFFALSYFSLYLDYFYPRGGVGRLAGAMREKFLELGGTLRTQTTVTAVEPARHTVTDAQGVSYAYHNLVWAADLKTLYRICDPSSLTGRGRERFARGKDRMLRHRGGDSVFTLFLQVDAPPESFGRIAQGHFFYTPSRQGLGETHRGELRELLGRFEQAGRAEVLAWLDRFIALNTFEISIPALKDPATAAPGKTGVIISFLAEYELFEKVRQVGWLEEFTAAIEERLIRVMAETVFPQLKDQVAAHWSFSPLSIHERTGSSEGAIVGWEFQPDLPVTNQIQKAAGAVLTPLPDIYQAGQWAYSPAGVPMSILTGKLAANRIAGTRKKG